MRRLQLTTKEANPAVPNTPVHGPGGALAFAGVHPEIVSAMQGPEGIYQVLLNTPGAVQISEYENEKYAVLTGQTAGTGSLPVARCDDAPVAGKLKLCHQNFTFGFISQDSTTIDLTKANRVTDRSEAFDFRLANSPLAPASDLALVSAADALKNDQAKVAFEMANEFERRISPLMWTANPANDTASDGYMEPFGLQLLIQTGWRDAKTGTVCPAADPLVHAFNANLAADPAASVKRVVDMFRHLERRARKAQLNGVVFAFVGPAAMLDKLAEIWPCAYNTAGCTLPSGASSNVDAVTMRKWSDEMRSMRYLPIDGDKIPFIVDDTMPETYVDADTYSADLYILPMVVPALTSTGGRSLILQFGDMRRSLAANVPAAFDGVVPGQIQVSGGGRFLVYKKAPKNTCIQYGMAGYWRLVLRTPFLAGRLTGVSYDFSYHDRTWNPAGIPTGYNFVNGGSTSQPIETLYTPHA